MQIKEYDFKQSPSTWFERFSKAIIVMKYKQSQSDHTLFIKHSALGRVTTLLVYMDNIIVTNNDLREKEALWQCLAREFEIKELGRLMYFLRIKVGSVQGGYLSFTTEICN